MRLRHALGLMLMLAVVRTSPAAETLPAASQWIPAEAVAEVEVLPPGRRARFRAQSGVGQDDQRAAGLPKGGRRAEVQAILGRGPVSGVSTSYRLGRRRAKTDRRRHHRGGRAERRGDRSASTPKTPPCWRSCTRPCSAFAGDKAAKKAAGDGIASTEYRGVKVWSSGDGGAHALVGNRLLLANRVDVLKAALDLRAGVGSEHGCGGRLSSGEEGRRPGGRGHGIRGHGGREAEPQGSGGTQI